MIAHDRPRHSRAHRPVRALPQPQVRSDPAEGLLPPAGLAVRLRGGGSSADVAGSSEAVRKEAGRDRTRASAELRGKIREIEQPYRDRLLPEKYKKFPAECAGGDRDSGSAADAGPGAAGEPGDPDGVGRPSAEIDRIMQPEDLAREASSPRKSRASRREARADSGGHGNHRWRLPVHSGRPGRRARAGQGRKQRSHRGQLSAHGPGPLSAAAVVLPDSRRREQPRLADAARLRDGRHLRQSADGDCRRPTATLRAAGGRWPNGWCRRTIR